MCCYAELQQSGSGEEEWGLTIAADLTNYRIMKAKDEQLKDLEKKLKFKLEQELNVKNVRQLIGKLNEEPMVINGENDEPILTTPLALAVQGTPKEVVELLIKQEKEKNNAVLRRELDQLIQEKKQNGL